MHIVLVEPEIPSNTGNIARTCVLTGSPLHLVEPLGFSLEDRYLKRAGLDYWPLLKLYRHKSLAEVKQQYTGNRFLYISTRGSVYYNRVHYRNTDFLVFGKETAGLPDEIIESNLSCCLRIPMTRETNRSLNLANAVAIVLYEGLRQLSFPGLQ